MSWLHGVRNRVSVGRASTRRSSNRHARAIESQRPRPAAERWFRRLLFSVLPYPARLRLLAVPLALVAPIRRSPALLKLLPMRLRSMLTLAPAVTLADTRRETPELTPASGRRANPCRARHRLRAAGVFRRREPGDGAGAGRRRLRGSRARDHRDAAARWRSTPAKTRPRGRSRGRSLQTSSESGVDAIAVNAAGCGSAMKEYGHLLQDDPAWAERARAFASKVRDVTEMLAGLRSAARAAPSAELRVAYHDACHLAHAQGVRARAARACWRRFPA